MGWELLVVLVVGVLAVIGLIWILAGRWVSASKKAEQASDDLAEKIEQAKADQRYHDATTLPPPMGEKLDELELERLRRAEARAGKVPNGGDDAA